MAKKNDDYTVDDITRWVELVKTLGIVEALKVQKQKMKFRKEQKVKEETLVVKPEEDWNNDF